MGTVANKLKYLNETKQQLKDTINYAGGDVDSSTAFRAYPEKLYDNYNNILMNGTDDLFNAMPKRTDLIENTSFTINNTIESAMKISLKPSEIIQDQFLPEGYTQVDYIQADGNQYIDTGVIGTNDHGVEIEYAITQISSSTSARIFGTRNDAGGVGAFGYMTSADGSSNSKYYLASNGNGLTLNIQVDTNWHKVSFNITNDKKVYFDENLVFTGNSTAFTANASAVLFRAYNQTIYTPAAKAKVKTLKIYNNGILIHNYIPCYRNSDNEIGIYDIIDGAFLTNGGTGTFTYGAIATLPAPDFPCEIHTISGNNKITINNKNLFDKEKAILKDGYYRNDNGNESTNSSAGYITNFIQVEPNTYYTLSGSIGPNGWVRIYYYNKNKKWISRTGAGGPSMTFHTPINCYYIQFQYHIETLNINTIQIEKGQTITNYIQNQNQTMLLNLPVKNLFDKDNANIISGYLNASNNKIVSYENNKTIYLSCKPNTTYTIKKHVWNQGGLRVGFFSDIPAIGSTAIVDTIAFTNLNQGTFTTTNETNYFAILVYNDYDYNSGATVEEILAGVQIEEGPRANSYQPYGTAPIEVCKIGDYEDEFVKLTDKIQVPEGYTQVEYLQSTGNQFFDTGFIPTENTKILMDFKSNKQSGEDFTTLFGAQKSATEGRCYILFGGTNNYQVNLPRADNDYAGLNANETFIKSNTGGYWTSDRAVFILDIQNKQCKINNKTWNLSTLDPADFVSPNCTLRLLDRNMDGTTYTKYSKGLTYKCQIWNNEILIRNMIPCFRNLDNKPGLYDTINEVFYTNQGTGEFICGNIINKWYLEKNIGKYIFTGNETWDKSQSGTTTNSFGCITNEINPAPKLRATTSEFFPGYFNRGQCGGSLSAYDNIFTYNVNSYHFLKITKAAIPNWDESLTDNEKIVLFKNYLKTFDNYIYYLINNPQNILLNDTLQTQLDNIYGYLKSYNEQTNISQNNNDLPFIITPTIIKKYSDI